MCLKYQTDCLEAVKHGCLDCLKYAHNKGVPWDERTCSWASHLGSLECLKYAVEHGCPIDTDYCLLFTQYNCKGYLEGLKKE